MKKFRMAIGWGLMVLLPHFLMTGCEKSTTDPTQDLLQMSIAAEEGLTSSWQTIHNVSSVGEVHSILEGGVEIDQSEFGGIYSTDQIASEYEKFQTGLETVLSSSTEGITLDDSLIWFIDWTDPISGVSVRKALYYSTVTGYARYYEAIYHFPIQLRLAYDSTEIRADLNFTLEDESDDRFLALYKITRFKDGFFVNKIEAEAQASDWDQNNQVIGAIASNHVWYGEQSRLDQLLQELEINPDESGQISERLDYRDGTFLQKIVNFYSDFTGDFSEIWRNGTQVSGTFDRIEDDNHASLTRRVDFPAGFFVDKIDQLADITLEPADSSSHLLLNEKILFAAGLLDTSELVIDEYYESGLKKTHLIAAKSNGARADLLVTNFPGYQEVDGNYTGPRGYFSLIHAIFYSDGSGELWLTVYESEQTYLNGEPALATIYIRFNPDGSGDGEIAEGGEKYSVQVNPDGEMLVRDSSGNSKTVNGY
ncbi:MAG: hypothetical protein JSW33_01795 [bacterium]|nr:MAG: hypothetical protein JSW33_01795 [bacterium]